MPSSMDKAKYTITAPLNLKKINSIVSKWSTDDMAKKIEEAKEGDLLKNKFFASKEYDFKDIKKCYKLYSKMTFNGFVFGVLGKSLDNFFKLNGINDAKKILAHFPVNLRPMPTSYDDLILDNSFSTSVIQLPLMDDISKIHETIRPSIQKLVTNEFLYASYYLLR